LEILAGNLCLQAGGSPLNAVSFITPENKIVVVVQNSGSQAFSFKLSDAKVGALGVSIPPNAIQTFFYSVWSLIYLLIVNMKCSWANEPAGPRSTVTT
jgi:hypothetical protein